MVHVDVLPRSHLLCFQKHLRSNDGRGLSKDVLDDSQSPRGIDLDRVVGREEGQLSVLQSQQTAQEDVEGFERQRLPSEVEEPAEGSDPRAGAVVAPHVGYDVDQRLLRQPRVSEHLQVIVVQELREGLSGQLGAIIDVVVDDLLRVDLGNVLLHLLLPHLQVRVSAEVNHFSLQLVRRDSRKHGSCTCRTIPAQNPEKAISSPCRYSLPTLCLLGSSRACV
mmetsp:Transcript_3526/g.12316  ORF Transcript_3526/g.12316 Transcript_3526/m.12316 type:complete len:222 (-) Transcript_3526:1493-2158(-)